MDLAGLRTAKKRVGVKQTIRALEGDSVALAYLA